jgi:hypothetical protein
MTEDELKKLVAEAQARFDAMTPEQQAEHREAQRQSWVRGEMGWPQAKYKWIDGVKVYDSIEDYYND